MANLVPEDYKKGVACEYQLRLAAGGLGLLAVVFIAAIALLIPSFILIEARHTQQKETLRSVSKTSLSTSTKQNRQTIKRVNKKLKLIDSNQSVRTKPTETLKLLASARPNGVTINNISFEVNSEDKQRVIITLRGVADTRGDLLTFEENLQNKAQVASVNLPVETLASSREAEFNMTVIVQKI